MTLDYYTYERECDNIDNYQRKLQSKFNSKNWREKNRERYNEIARKFRENHRDYYKKISSEYYYKNRLLRIEYQKKYSKITNYASEKTLKQRKIRYIKRKTRKYFPLANHFCEFCGDKATEHHHNTLPIEFDKFNYVCHICHIQAERQLKGGKTNMANLKDSAKAYQPKRTRNIAELEVVNLETIQIEDRNGTNDDGKEFSYKVAIIGSEEYRVPMSVLGSIKTILDAKPSLKTVRVIKKGQGMNTEYTVIPLD